MQGMHSTPDFEDLTGNHHPITKVWKASDNLHFYVFNTFLLKLSILEECLCAQLYRNGACRTEKFSIRVFKHLFLKSPKSD